MAEFKLGYKLTVGFEYGWCNIPSDRGGETYNGCARNFFDKWKGWIIIDREKSHPSFKQGQKEFTKHLSTIPELTILIEEWYREEWWDKLGLSALPQDLANEIFEQTVNLGKSGAGKYIQKMCNAFNYDVKNEKPFFTDLIVDGAIGPKTISALSILLKQKTSEKELVHALNCLQGYHYINIASTIESQRLFILGWMSRTK